MRRSCSDYQPVKERNYGDFDKSIMPIFETEMLIYQSEANFEAKILFGKITHYVEPEIRKMLERGLLWSKDPTFHFGP